MSGNQIRHIKREDLQRFSNLELLARQVVEGFITGRHRSPFHGFSVEFAEHRHYRTGESTRFIDWKLFARSDKLYVKRYEEETNLRCHLVLDVSASMRYPTDKGGKAGQRSKLFFSIMAAAALIELMQKQRDAASLTLFSDKLEASTEAKMSKSHQRLLYKMLEEALEAQNKHAAVDPAKVLHELAERLPKRGLVVVFSDFTQPDQPLEEQQQAFDDALGHIKHKGHEVVLFHVVSKKEELELNLGDAPLRLIDLETGKEVKARPEQIQEKYRKKMQEHVEAMRYIAVKYGMDWHEADADAGFDEVLWKYLVRRKK